MIGRCRRCAPITPRLWTVCAGRRVLRERGLAGWLAGGGPIYPSSGKASSGGCHRRDRVPESVSRFRQGVVDGQGRADHGIQVS